LVHRDIKPTNLLLAPGTRVKITDFGIAHAAGSAPLTRTGTLIGTPAYLAPERVAGGPATPASDLYSLGVVCYECLTGTRPFTGTPLEVALAHKQRELPPLPPHVPTQIGALVAGLTAKDPAARPASAADAARWAARLRDAALPDEYATAPPTTVAGPPPVTLVGAPTQVMADPSPGSHRLPARTPVLPRVAGSRRVLVLVIGAVGIAVALAGWLVSSVGAAHPVRHHAGGALASASPTSPRMVRVNQAVLVGQPVSTVHRLLRQLSLRVRVIWRYDGHQQPGTVVSVQPAGPVLAGTRVLVVGALTPPGHGDGHGHGGGNDQGNGGGGGD
jgi:eukaryotic-like serine/threonine-protein kinase